MALSRILAAALVALAAAATRLRAQDPVPLYPDNYKVMIENERVRVMDFRLRKGDTERFHSHPAHVLYVLEPFTIRFKLPDGSTAVRRARAGELLFSEAVTHSPTNIGEGDAHGILVELKTPAARQAVAAGATRDELLTAVTFIQGREGTGDAVKRELLTLTAPTRAEPGNLVYDLYQSADRSDRFMRIEVWRNGEALELHKTTPHLRASFERRKDAGWATEITRWHRVQEEAGEQRAALGR